MEFDKGELVNAEEAENGRSGDEDLSRPPLLHSSVSSALGNAFNGDDAELTRKIIGAAIEVHREFGCGLKEDAYEAALSWELRNAGLNAARQVPCPVIYKGMVLSERDEHAKRIDILVEDRVVVELKAVSRKEPVFAAQCLTYLKMMNLRTGLVLNFGFPTLKEGITHVVNPSAKPPPLLHSSVFSALSESNK